MKAKFFLIMTLFVGIGVFYLSSKLGNVPLLQRSKAGTSTTVPWTYPRKVKVLILRYFNPASVPDFKNPSIAQTITDNMRGNLFEASKFHGSPYAVSAAQFDVAGQYDFNTAAPNINNDWEATYNSILNTALPGTSQTACDKVNADGIDEVWFLGDPTVAGFINGPEFAISSKYIQANSVPSVSDKSVLPKQQFCGGKKSLLVYFIDLSRPGTSVHAFAHYMEALIGATQSVDLFYKNYMGINYYGNGLGIAIPGVSLADHCGSAHIPPNSAVIPNTAPAQYAYTASNWSNGTAVMSSCPNWKPDGSGQKVSVSAATWINMPTNLAGTPEFKFHMWWLENMPNISNGLTYKNLPIPNWWDFVADTDNTIAWYLNSPYFINPDLFGTQFANKTTACTGTSGVTTSCTTSSVLGTQTENNQVLGTSTYGNFALVTVLYTASPSVPNIFVNSVTYCGAAMTRIGNAPTAGAGHKTEMWYKTLPQTGSCPVVATFNTNPGQRIVTATIFNNIDTVTPVANYTTSVYNTPTANTPSSITMSLAGPKDSLLLCTYSQYSEQTVAPGGNHATATTGTLQLWKFEDGTMNGVPANVWGGLGAGIQRATDNQMVVLKWDTVKTMPWSATCANVNVKPFGTTSTPTPTPSTPTPSPTPNPTPVATSVPVVDIKANGLDRLYATKITNFTLSWTTKNAVSCKGLGNWSGTKPVTGSTVVPVPTSGAYYVLQCTSSTGAVWYDRVDFYPTANTTDGKMFVNGFDDTINPVGSGVIGAGTQQKLYLPKGTKPSLTWSIYGITSGGVFAGSCTFGWTKATPTQPAIMAAINVTTTYQMYCQKSTSGTPTTYSTTAFIK